MVNKYYSAFNELKQQQQEQAEKQQRKKARKARREKKKAERKKAAAAEEKRLERARAAEAKKVAQAAKRAAKRKAAEPSDDDEDDSPAPSTELATPTVVHRPAPKRARRSGPSKGPDGESAATAIPVATPREPCPFLEKLPLEIREIIYTYLLAPDPTVRFRVCKGWTETLKGRGSRQQNRREIHTAIMRTNSQIADECIRILYGSNEFEYRLRDAPLPTDSRGVRNRLDDAGGDDPQDTYIAEDEIDDDEEESDDEYREAPVAARRRTISSNRARRPSRKAPAGDQILVIPPHEAFNPDVQINITKFGHHCRRIRIVAEPGRDTAHYRAAMAQAIGTFCNLFPLRSRLHTLSIEIEPVRDQLSPDNISFIDFFEPNTDVIKALRGLPCQFIKFLIHTELVNEKTGRKEAEILLDLRPAASIRRAARGEHDMWADDEVAMKKRKEAAIKTQKAMLTLPAAIQQAYMLHEVEYWYEFDEDETADLAPEDVFWMMTQ